jgi:phosphoribosylglycinamide formyltransferase-1
LWEIPLHTSPLRVVVLVSGAGTNLQALLDACADASYNAEVVAVGADRHGTLAIERAQKTDVPTFVLQVSEFALRGS